jgi:hypothetical protein
MNTKTKAMKPLAVIGAGVAVTAAALATAVLQGSTQAGDIASSGMSTGITITAATPVSAQQIPAAVPSIKGPAPLPLEEQGLPG